MAVVVNNTQLVSALYVAIFNRAPDKAGLDSWVAQMAAGKSFADVSTGFTGHEVFTQGIGTLGNAAFINALYTNVLGSAGDAAGVAGWVALLNGGASKASIAASFVQAALTVDIPALLASGALTAADAAAAQVRQDTLTNKANVGIYFTTTLGAASNLNPLTVSSSKAGLEADPIYNASKAAIAGVTNTAASVQTAKDAIAVAAGSTNPAQSLLGGTFTLTAGVDTIVGTSGNDTINALTVKADGSTGSTVTAFDSIDGGAGNDTLNIFTATGLNDGALPANFTVKNVETINYNNANSGFAVDASKFVGATAINQNGFAGAVTELAAGTTAGFKDISAGSLSVQAAATAASASVSLNGVSEGTTSLTVGGTVLNSVSIAGSVKDTNNNGVVAPITVNINAGAAQTALTLNTAVNSTVSVTGAALTSVNAAGSTGAVALVNGVQEVQTIALGTLVNSEAYTLTVGGTTLVTAATDATTTSAELLAAIQATAGYAAAPFTVALNGTSDALVLTWKATGDIATLGSLSSATYAAVTASETAKGVAGAVNVQTVSTGSGDDTVSTSFATTADKAATVTTGAGKDTITVLTTGAGLTTVDAGAGDDVINVTKATGNKLNIQGGEGNDVVTLSGAALATTDVIDGGAGTDTVSVAGSATARTDDDFIVFNKLLKGFETLKLSSTEGSSTVSLDASKLAASYTTIDLAAGSYIDNVSGQALVANGALNAEAAGYKSAVETKTAGGAEVITYAGTLNITDSNLAAATDAIRAHAETVNLTVKGGSANGVTANNSVLTGEAKTATVTLSAGTDTKGTVVTTDDALVASSVSITTANAVGVAETLKDLASLTLTGNGVANIINGNLTKLTTVDATGLNSVNEKGVATTGLVYTSTNTAAETIKLGAGLDVVKLGASTYGKVDIVSGLNLVATAADAKAVDTAKSDLLKLDAAATFKAFTTTQTDLDLALKDAAASALGDNLVFQMGGNTYVYQDKLAGGVANTVDAGDTVVQIVGQVNLDLLISSLAVA